MEVWFFYAVGAAVFAALTTILAKVGLKDVDSHLATAIRTMVVLVFAWIMVFVVGGYIRPPDARTWVFLILSGIATGASWLCFFRALKLGSVNRVVPIDKSSTILTIIMAFIFLGEPVGAVMVAGMVLMAVGTGLMLELKKDAQEPYDSGGENSDRASRFRIAHAWLVYAILAAVFASLTAILAKVGMAYIEASLGTAIRTMAVVPMSWLMVFITKGQKNIGKISKKSWLFLLFSGVATGASWLLFFQALQIGNASLVVPVDKLSIVFTMGFARLFLGERFSRRSLIGLALLTAGTLIPVVL